jgi:hypothetical protein
VVLADVVEDAVQADPDAALLGRADQGVEVVQVAEARVDPEVVEGVVAVRGRGEDGGQHEAVGAEVDQVLQPAGQPPEPVLDLALGQLVGPVLAADEPQRVAVPPDHRRDPVHPCLLRRAGRQTLPGRGPETAPSARSR